MKQKNLFHIGVASYLTMLIGSIFYLKERTVIFDASYQLFHVLAKDDLAIQVNRFGAAVTQIFPLVASRLQLPLSVVAALYSASFVVFYFASFLFTWLVLKNQRMALVILLFNTLLTAHSFFWIQCELVQGVVFTLVFLASVENQMHRSTPTPLFWALFPFLIVTIVFFYPLLPFVLLFGLAFFALHYKSHYRFLTSIGAGYLLVYGLKVFFFKTGYDSGAMGGVVHFKTLFPNYFTIASNRNLLLWIAKDYYFLAFFFAAIVFFYLRNRRFGKLFLFAGFFLGLTALINVVNYSGSAQQFYLEPQYSLLAVFVGVVATYDLLPAFRKPLLPTLALNLILLLCFVRIVQTGKEYTARLSWYRETMQQTPDKTILAESATPVPLLKMTWGSAYEWWLLSTLETGQTKSLIIEEKPGEFDWALDNRRGLLTKWEIFPYENLTPRYFVLKDTVNTYSRKQ